MDGLAWYEQELDREYIAWLHGYDNYEDYYNDYLDTKENLEYEERILERM